MPSPSPQVSSVRFVWLPDCDGQPDYLETSPESHYGDDGSAWAHVAAEDIKRVESGFGSVWDACVADAKQDAERLARFKTDDLWFEGCYAVAEISYEVSPSHWRLDRLRSAGLWGIESDSGADYRQSVEADELADLSSHLERFGISATVDDLLALTSK